MTGIEKRPSFICRIFEGNVQALLDYGFAIKDVSSVSEISIGGSEEAESIKERLQMIPEHVADSIVIVMEDPYRMGKGLDWDFDHVLVGPLFAALLLKEYDLARNLLAKNPRPFIKGRVVNVNDDGGLFAGDCIYMGQLFLVDPDIPEDLAEGIHKVIVKYYGYDLITDLFENKYLQLTDEMPQTQNYFWDDDKPEEEPYFARKLEKLRREYPMVFDSLFGMLTGGSISAEFFTGYLNNKDRSMIMRMVCKYHSSDHKGMLFWFEEETKAIFQGCFAAFLFYGLSEAYLTDVKAVYKHLKDAPDYYPRFMKAVTMMAIRFGNEQLEKIVTRALRDKGFIKLGIEDLAINLWGDDQTDPEISPLYEEVKSTFSSDDYIDYIVKLMKLYKKATKEKICLSENSRIMKNYYSTVRCKDNIYTFFGESDDQFTLGQKQNSDPDFFREQVKRFLGLVDSVKREDDPYRMGNYDMPLLRIADEELIVQNFEKELLSPAKADEYIKGLIATGRTSLVPAITAFM